MKIKKISVTQLKNNMADILNEVAYTKVPAEIYKHNDLFVTITPVTNNNYSNISKKDKLFLLREKYASSEANFPDVIKDRVSKNLDSIYE